MIPLKRTVAVLCSSIDGLVEHELCGSSSPKVFCSCLKSFKLVMIRKKGTRLCISLHMRAVSHTVVRMPLQTHDHCQNAYYGHSLKCAPEQWKMEQKRHQRQRTLVFMLV